MARPLSAAVAAVCLLQAAEAAAQVTSDSPAGDSAHVVVIEEKSAFAAGALEWILPTAGYAYAGSWSRGIPSAVVRLVGFVLVFEDQFTIIGEPPPCGAQCGIGVAMTLAGTIWGVVDAGATAKRTNARRRAALRDASLLPALGPLGPGLAVRVPVDF